VIFFYEFLHFVFCDVTNLFIYFFFENFNFKIFGCQNNNYEGFKSLSNLRINRCIIEILTDSFSHLNGLNLHHD
jgi:hypothetical protein